MHRHALAARHIAHDAFAANGIAALGAIYQQIVDTPHFDDVVAIHGPAGHRAWHGGAGFGGGFGPGFGGLVLDDSGSDLGEHLTRRKLPVPERRIQVLHLAVSVVRRDVFHIALGDLAELHAKTPRFFIEVLLPDFDRLQTLAGVDEVL